jgi:hypothetical protein
MASSFKEEQSSGKITISNYLQNIENQVGLVIIHRPLLFSGYWLLVIGYWLLVIAKHLDLR